MQELVLISHPLCPYVQRAAIALAEKRLPFRRMDIDLAAKPEWFLAISPLGKTPVLQVGDAAIFESSVILEYLEDTMAPALHPADALARARHRGWVEFSSAMLNDIAGLYSAADDTALRAMHQKLANRLRQVDLEKAAGPWFDGPFSLVDAAFAPVFRYFDVIDRLVPALFADLPRVLAWRQALAARPSVRAAVAPDYDARLLAFLRARASRLGDLARAADPHCQPA